MDPSTAINPRAQTGFANSAAYDQHRPAYTSTVVQLLLQNLRLSGAPGAKVLDLAAGTGKFTEALAAREEGFEVVAVEPHGEMRAVLEGKGLRGVSVVEGRADAIPLGDGGLDGVVCAQAFHWFANMEALREIHRVLKPHGALGMVWNIEDVGLESLLALLLALIIFLLKYNAPRGHKATTEWEGKLHDLTWTFQDDAPRFRHEEWRKVFDKQTKSTPLSLIIPSDQLFSLPLAETEEPFEVRLSKEKLWERYNTLSQIAMLEGEERERTYKTFMDILSSPDVEVDDDGNVVAHGATTIVWTGKIPEDGRDGLGDTVGTP